MITLVLGGARSGKSEVAERLASAAPQPVTYLATASAGDDPDFRQRISVHQARRPAAWATVESGPDLPGALAGLAGTVLIDSLGTWVASTPDFAVDRESLCSALTARSGTTVIVSEEVGLGVHPSTHVGGRFRDALGLVNQAVAAVADRAVLVVAGRCLTLDPPDGGGA
jgi:adenosyl cobinamide kinase/adenosyl cobinamide phosphate guanylyltransferase